MVKKLNFKKWLKKQDIDTDYFWNQCKKKNQRWVCEDYGKPRKNLKKYDNNKWITEAFAWHNTKQGWDYWDGISNLWEKACKDKEVKFGFN